MTAFAPYQGLRTADGYPTMHVDAGGAQEIMAGVTSLFGVAPSSDDMNPENLRQVDMYLADDHFRRRAVVQVENLLRLFIESVDTWHFRLCPPEHNPNERFDWTLTTVIPATAELAPELVSPSVVETAYEKHSVIMTRMQLGWRSTLEAFKTPEGRRIAMLNVANVGSSFITAIKLRVNGAVLRANYFYKGFNQLYGPSIEAPDMQAMHASSDRIVGAASRSPTFVYQAIQYFEQIFDSEQIAYDTMVVPAGELNKLVFKNPYETTRQERGPKAESRLRFGGAALAAEVRGKTVLEDRVWRNFDLPVREQELLVDRCFIGRAAGIYPAEHAAYMDHEHYNSERQHSFRMHDMRNDKKHTVFVRDTLRQCGRFNSDGVLDDTHQELADHLNNQTLPAGVPGDWTDMNQERRADMMLYRDASHQYRVASIWAETSLADLSVEYQIDAGKAGFRAAVRRGAISAADVEAINALLSVREFLYSGASSAAEWTKAKALIQAATYDSATGRVTAPGGAVDRPYGYYSYAALKTLATTWAPAGAEGQAIKQRIEDGVRALEKYTRTLLSVFPATHSSQLGASSAPLAANPLLDGEHVSFFSRKEGDLFHNQVSQVLDNLLGHYAYPLYRSSAAIVAVAAAEAAILGGAADAEDVAAEAGDAAEAVVEAAAAARGARAANVAKLGFTDAAATRVAALLSNKEFSYFKKQAEQIGALANGANLLGAYLASADADAYFGSSTTRTAAVALATFYDEQLTHTDDNVGDVRVLASTAIMALERAKGRKTKLDRVYLDAVRKREPATKQIQVGPSDESAFPQRSYVTVFGDAAPFTAADDAAFTVNTGLSLDPEILQTHLLRTDAIRPANPATPDRAIDSTNDATWKEAISHAAAARDRTSIYHTTYAEYRERQRATSDGGEAIRRFVPAEVLSSSALSISPNTIIRYSRIMQQSLHWGERSFALLYGFQPITVTSVEAMIDSSRGNMPPPFSMTFLNPYAIHAMGNMLAFQSGRGTGRTFWQFPHTSVQYNSDKKYIQSNSTLRTESAVLDSRKMLVMRHCFHRGHVAGNNLRVFTSRDEFAELVRQPKKMINSPDPNQPGGFFFMGPATLTTTELGNKVYVGGQFDRAMFNDIVPSDIQRARRSHPMATYYSLFWGLYNVNQGKKTQVKSLLESYESTVVNSLCSFAYYQTYSPYTSQWSDEHLGTGPHLKRDHDSMFEYYNGREMGGDAAATFVSPMTV